MNHSQITLLVALTVRQNRMAKRLAEIIADHPQKLFDNAYVQNTYGQAFYTELASHHIGEPQVSTFFRDLYDTAPTSADSMRHSRNLQKLEAAGRVELLVGANGSRQVRWAVIKEVS